MTDKIIPLPIEFTPLSNASFSIAKIKDCYFLLGCGYEPMTRRDFGQKGFEITEELALGLVMVFGPSPKIAEGK